jgi:hypothetical protein
MIATVARWTHNLLMASFAFLTYAVFFKTFV